MQDQSIVGNLCGYGKQKTPPGSGRFPSSFIFYPQGHEVGRCFITTLYRTNEKRATFAPKGCMMSKDNSKVYDDGISPYGWKSADCYRCGGTGIYNEKTCYVCDGVKSIDYPLSAEEHIADLRAQLAASQQRVATLEAALDYYAQGIRMPHDSERGQYLPIAPDEGQRARRALADTPAQEGNE